MFQSARLKLTGWYLIIIMVVSLAFSGVIYRASTFELNRFVRAQQNRNENRVFIVDDKTVSFRPAPPQFDDDLLREAKNRILRSLMFINLGILSIASLLGYYLSGKTLEPIAEMMDEQYRFISDASHELKTPITAMKSTLEVSLRDDKIDLTEAKKTLKVSLEEVNGLQKLAEGLLELSSKHNELKMAPIKLQQTVNEAIKIIDPLAQLRSITIISTLVKVRIMGESESLKRAVTTVLDNAIKYSEPKDTIHVTSKIMGRRVVLKIKDDGIGISKEDVPQVFNRFYRSDKARSSEGHGLGLSIAKQIIEFHHGEISIDSKKGKGTTVRMTFPYSAQIQD